MIYEKQSEAPKKSNDFSSKALIIASVVLVFTAFILGITFSGVQCGEGCSVVYRVCPKYAGTRCDMLSSNDWRRLGSGLSRGPRFEPKQGPPVPRLVHGRDNLHTRLQVGLYVR